MELHAFHRKFAVAQAHDRFHRTVLVLGPGSDFQCIGQAGLVHHQRVVARGFVAVRQAGEHTAALMPDRRDLAVHDAAGADHLAA